MTTKSYAIYAGRRKQEERKRKARDKYLKALDALENAWAEYQAELAAIDAEEGQP